MPWFVLYTRPKAEKKVAEQLEKLGIVVYCPIVVKVQQWSDRKKKVAVPLFSSYVFVNLAEADRNIVFEVNGVVRYLFWQGQPGIVQDWEIDAIRQMVADEPASLEVNAIQPGDHLTIAEGAFKDHSGVVKAVTNKTIQLVLNALGVVLTIKHSK